MINKQYRAIYGYPTRHVGNPYIVYGISVNKLMFTESSGMTNHTLPNTVLWGMINQLVGKSSQRIILYKSFKAGKLF